MKKPELVFIPTLGAGHLGSTVEVAKRLVNQNNRLCITLLILEQPSEFNTTTHYPGSLSSTDSICFHHLPQLPSLPDAPPLSYKENYKVHVKDAIAELILSDPSHHLTSFMVDMFCTSMIDVIDEFSIPYYTFYTSSVQFLGLILHLQSLRDADILDTSELQELGDMELAVPTFSDLVLARCLPTILLDKKWAEILLAHTQ